MHSRTMLFAKLVRWLALCVLALGALGVHARAMQNAPLEKIASLNADCTPARAAQVLDAPEEIALNYGARMSGATIYVYAHSDPVHGSDPSGRETTMMGLSIGMSVSAVNASLAVTGLAAASFLYPYAANAVSTTLWDILVYSRISHQVPQAAVDAAVISEAKHKNRTDKPNEAHHTIPMYLCGNDSQEKPVITFAQHQGIHAGLSAVLLFIELAGDNAAQTLGIPLSRWRKPAILEVGRNEFGRRGIASAIGAFYAAYGSAFGTPRPIGIVFPAESELFVGGPRHPLCY